MSALEPVIPSSLPREMWQEARQKLQARPYVAMVLAWYCVTRVWGAWLISLAAKKQLPSPWTPANSNYFDLAQLWDGQWYKLIAESGYPAKLPMDEFGVVQQNEWAFFPGFPYATRFVMWLGGYPFSQSAVILNLVAAGAAMVFLFWALERQLGAKYALGGVVIFCAAPVTPVLQIAYSESVALFLLALFFYFLGLRKYGWCGVVVLILAFTRPVVAPLAAVLLVHMIARYRAHYGVVRWSGERQEFPRLQQLAVAGLGLGTAASSLLWPAMAGWVTGIPDAYQRTQGSWRSRGELSAPFVQAADIFNLLWGERGWLWVVAGGVLLLGLLLSRWGRVLGSDFGAWTIAYPLFFLAVTEPWTSTYRYALFLVPLAALAARILRWWPLWLIVVGLGFWGQQEWINQLLLFRPPTSYPP